MESWFFVLIKDSEFCTEIVGRYIHREVPYNVDRDYIYKNIFHKNNIFGKLKLTYDQWIEN